MMIKSKVDRRDFLKIVGLGTAISLFPLSVKANISTPRVVVVGGGYSGRSVAKYLKLWGGSSVEVILVDKSSSYISPILSNLVLNGQRTLMDLEFDFSNLSKYNVGFINKEVTLIDKDSSAILLSDGNVVSYDKLVLATGVDFIQSNSYSFDRVPHGWIAGTQTEILKEKIETLQSGDSFIITIPKAPYRCPPAPYERASLVADYLKNRKGLSVNITVLDENSEIIVDKDSFKSAFDRYGIEYIPNAKVTNVDDSQMSLKYLESGVEKEISAKVINVIPNQRAVPLVIESGLCDDSGFAPVNMLNYESIATKNIHIIGDSHKSILPKAGHIANSEAKICADAILRELNGYELYPKPKTNSACYSPLSASTATWLTAVYEYDISTASMVVVSQDSGYESSKNYKEMFNWSRNLFSDSFS
jgi:NADPH-dependent 2,4-dienoyl-CoA reductase/sulfur reductase-like enzyme